MRAHRKQIYTSNHLLLNTLTMTVHIFTNLWYSVELLGCISSTCSSWVKTRWSSTEIGQGISLLEAVSTQFCKIHAFMKFSGKRTRCWIKSIQGANLERIWRWKGQSFYVLWERSTMRNPLKVTFLSAPAANNWSFFDTTSKQGKTESSGNMISSRFL